eukprot:UN01826
MTTSTAKYVFAFNTNQNYHPHISYDTFYILYQQSECNYYRFSSKDDYFYIHIFYQHEPCLRVVLERQLHVPFLQNFLLVSNYVMTMMICCFVWYLVV